MKLKEQFNADKASLRIEYKAKRRLIEEKSKKDFKIAEFLLNSEIFGNAELVLCYASLKDEVETDYIIEQTLKIGKIVAVPKCTDNNGNMEFYRINSIDDTKIGLFGVREPDTNICKLVESFDKSILIVPGLAFDKKGYRLGYGKGYYDRFLEKYTSNSIGLCYNALVVDKIPNDDYDRKVNFLITEDNFKKCE